MHMRTTLSHASRAHSTYSHGDILSQVAHVSHSMQSERTVHWSERLILYSP